MKTPEKLQWLFGPSIDAKEIIITAAAVFILLGVLGV